MSETTLQINHSNFKQNRTAYGITLREIADRACVSVMTVQNYEKYDSSYIRTRNRDDNARRIERALSELIDERVVRTFPNAVDKEEKVVEEKRKGHYHPCKNFFDRKYVSEKIKQYCVDKNIALADFCRMCNIATSNFADCTIQNNPHLYPRTIAKIISATGWTIDMFKEEKNIPFSSSTNKKEDVVPALDKTSDTTEKKNKQFIFRDGKYFMEYDIVVIEHKVEEISKEEFLKHIN